MRILVVGAGAIGGYFGGRLLQAHRDVFDAQGTVVHLNDIHSLPFDERDQAISERIGWLASTLNSVGFDSRLSEDIVR